MRHCEAMTMMISFLQHGSRGDSLSFHYPPFLPHLLVLASPTTPSAFLWYELNVRWIKNGLPCHGRGEIPALPYMAAGSSPLPHSFQSCICGIGGADSPAACLHTDKSSSEREIGWLHTHSHARAHACTHTLYFRLLRALKQSGFSAVIVTLAEQRQITSIFWKQIIRDSSKALTVHNGAYISAHHSHILYIMQLGTPNCFLHISSNVMHCFFCAVRHML